MTPPLTASPQAARWPRRQTALPPGAPVTLLGVDAVYDSRIAFARLWQLYRVHVQAPELPGGYRWRDIAMPPAVRELAAQCDLLLGPAPNRVVVACPGCGHEAYVLHLAGGGWCCRDCDAPRWTQLDQSLATYGHGLRIGLTGRPMVWRHRRILRALTRLAETPVGRSTLAARLRRGGSLPLSTGLIRTVVHLAKSGVVVAHSPHWVRRHPCRGEAPRPRACLGLPAVEDAIAEYLSPTAYLAFLSGPE